MAAVDQPMSALEQLTQVAAHIRDAYGGPRLSPEQAAARTAELEARRATSVAAARRWWGELLFLAQVNPVLKVVLDLHGPNSWGDCDGPDHDSELGTAWPCDTLEAVAAAVNLPFPDLPHGRIATIKAADLEGVGQ